MRHLIISREYPPAAYPPGGIGAYVANIARLMAERGEIVHIIGQRWQSAPQVRESLCGGRLIVHRIGADDLPAGMAARASARMAQELDGLKRSDSPSQWFAWHAALLAERLIDDEGIDVVEGQEWEAPLYYLLLRRALGMGSRRQAPCIVHLHSPSEVIRQYNGALDAPRSYASMKRMEEFCIRAADALLCPSHYFAQQAGQRFGLKIGQVKVIHLPVGFTPRVERRPQVWAEGSICFVGRLEPRKGIIEWMAAAARVVREDPRVHFDFVGADVWGLRRTLMAQLSRKFRPRFRFHGSQERSQLPDFLARACAAVVPSRWENFPNVCIEAMSSGLPVIATRLGGMVELIEDGRSGWLAPETGVAGMIDGLATALRRCLAASPEERESMGRVAGEAVRRICDNDRTVQEHIAFRGEVARIGVRPMALFAQVAPVRHLRDMGGEGRAGRSGAGVVVHVDSLKSAEPVLRSLEAQSQPPRATAIVCAATPSGDDERQAGRLAGAGTMVLFQPERSGADAWNAGFGALHAREDCGFWLFLDGFDFLLPDCIARMTQVLAAHPEIGIVSLWTRRVPGRQLDAPLSPDLAHQLIRNEVVPASAFRADALGTAPPFRPGLPREYDVWDLANRIIAKGWAAVTCPELLSRRAVPPPRLGWPEITAFRTIRAEVLAHLGDAPVPVALGLVDDYVPLPQGESPAALAADEPAHRRALRYLAGAMLHPRRASRALIRRSQKLLTTNGPWPARAAEESPPDHV
jgi:glycogen synthase